MQGKWSTGGGRAMRGILVVGMVMMCMVLSVVSEEEAVNSKLAVINYRARNLYPEGFDWDAKRSRFIVGSFSKGKLITVTEEGIVEAFVKDVEYAGASTLGVTVDSNRNRVLTVVHRFKGPPLSALAAYDLDSRDRTLFVNLAEDKVSSKGGVAMANDVAVDGEGNAYVTNSAGNLVWKVTLDGVKSVLVDTFPQHPVVVKMELAQAVTLNGIVYQDGYLVVCQTNSGALFRVRLADKRVEAVKIKDGAVMPGADGLALRSDGSLVVISIHTAWLVSSRDLWRTATVIDEVPLDAAQLTTSAAVADMRVFTLQSHFLDSHKGINRDSFKILEIAFPSDSNDNPLWLLAIVGLFLVPILVWKFQMNRFNKGYTQKRL